MEQIPEPGRKSEINGEQIIQVENLVCTEDRKLSQAASIAPDQSSSLEMTFEPVAIIGMAMRLPGGIGDTDAFWQMLVNKRDGRVLIPKDRYNVDGFFGLGQVGQVNSEYGYFLQDAELACLDTSFWSIGKQELGLVDPQQRLLLEVVYECLENSGTVKYREEDVGCYVGSFGEDWLNMQNRDTQTATLFSTTGSADFALANRLSYEFGFQGPSVTIRTACSSSLIGLHQACNDLKSGNCSAAIVAGANLILSPQMTISMNQQGILSPTGSSKTFSADADGYVRGEAVTAVYIKKLVDAIRDGDPIRAVIRSTCINSDGKTLGLTLPNSSAHEKLIRKSHALAGISDLSRTAMIECHGTGTQIGDPLEVEAVAAAFGEYGIVIGSVKPNVGHSEGASGITSLIKMVLALENRTIPPNINFHSPNPKIPFEAARLQVPLECLPWPAGRAERVGINSFGIGGANAHVLLESAASFGIVRENEVSIAEVPKKCQRLLLFSANHPESLRLRIDSYQDYLLNRPGALNDLSYTLSVRRDFLTHRSFCISDGTTPFQVSGSKKVDGLSGAPDLIWVFTGQGAQWPEMGIELIKSENQFRKSLENLDEILSALPNPPGWRLADEIMKPKTSSRLAKAEFSQPCCSAIQIALVDLLNHWGIKASAVLGHSSGEIAAAYACGALSAAQAIKVAYYRGQVSKEASEAYDGGMAAVGLSAQHVTTYLTDGVTIGCNNSPESVTLTGNVKQLLTVTQNIKKFNPEAFVRVLHVDCAYHSDQMRTVESKYLSQLQNIVSEKPNIPFFSTVTAAKLVDSESLSANYWAQNLVSPVLFVDALNALCNDLHKGKVFLEIGPHSALKGPIRQTLRKSDYKGEYIPSLIRSEDSLSAMLRVAGSLFLNNYLSDFKQITCGCLLTNLPTYPWHYEGHQWTESRLSRDWRMRKHPHHDILGSRVVESTDHEPAWRNLLRLETVPWVRDHEIAGNILFPAAGFIALAGEAIRQISDASDYTVRHVTINNALLLREDRPAELLTQFHRSRLTTTLDSPYYEFSVSSFDGTGWVKHAFGQVRASAERIFGSPRLQSLDRQIPPDSWYSVLRRFGLNYGPEFRKLTDISCGVGERRAIATVANETRSGESYYEMHPSTMDVCFQVLTVANYQGLGRSMRKLLIPTYIDELYVRRSETPVVSQAVTQPASQGSYSGDAEGFSGGDIILSLKGLRFSQLTDEDDVKGIDPHAAMEIHWRPYVNFLDASQLMRRKGLLTNHQNLLEEITLLCSIETMILLQDKAPKKAYLEKFRCWVGKYVDSVRNQQHRLASLCTEALGLDSEARVKLIEHRYRHYLDTNPEEGAAQATAIYQVYHHIEQIFSDTIEPLDVLLRDDLLTAIYNSFRVWDFAPLFQLWAHAKPTLKILEIGAGTGGATSMILPYLKAASGEPMYSSYTYTDVSSGFFVAAKERFKDYEAMEYAIFDVSQDPEEQGFSPEVFDIVIASNVLHATPSLKKTLENVRKLLHPRGHVMILELDPVNKFINFVMGILPGWWMGDDDDRADEPYVSPARWEQELRHSGFQGIDAMAFDGELSRTYIASCTSMSSPGRLTILHAIDRPRNHSLVQLLMNRGYELDFCMIDQPPPQGQPVVSLLDVENPFLAEIDMIRLEYLQKFLSSLHSAGILWITGAAQVGCQDPRYSLILGYARCARIELGLHFATLELEKFDDENFNLVPAVLHEFQNQVTDPNIDPVSEFVCSGGVVLTSNMHTVRVERELLEPLNESTPQRLTISRHGRLDTLHWQQEPLQSLTEKSVEIDVRAAGLNFRDVLTAMGIIEGRGDWLGLEFSGIVRATGPGVCDLKVGDRVLGISAASFASRLTVSEDACANMPDDLSFVDGATMPCVYLTVIHSLLDVARLEAGQSVLIHSACGGVGIAALHICEMMGANVYCTVGSAEKIEYLVKTHNVPRKHIFNSRDASFLDDVLAATQGRGIDIVLNSLSGELLHASWQCVAPFGIMIEIGKRDFIGQASLRMDLFESNRSFKGVDCAQITEERVSIITRALKLCMQYLRQGLIKPIRPLRVFEADRVQDAFRYMQTGQHMGKIVIQIPERIGSITKVRSRRRALTLRPDRAYLLVGGLGGLGRAVATFMVEIGARYLVFMSRSAGRSKEDQEFVQELEAQNCRVQVFSGDVCDDATVKQIIGDIPRPIAGVIQASMVLKDAAIATMCYEDWEAAIHPKVRGTWNLHTAMLKQREPLDFFVLFSSVSGLMGSGGQANYAAANSFLDAFVQYRHSMGLPASVINIGVMGDIGYVSRNKNTLDQLSNSSHHVLHEQDLLDSLHLMMERSEPCISTYQYTSAESNFNRRFVNKSQIAIGLRSSLPLDAPNNRTIWKRDPRMAPYRNTESHTQESEQATSDNVKIFLREAAAEPHTLTTSDSVTFLARVIGQTTFGLMLKSEDDLSVEIPLKALGLDSLVSIELRNWIRRVLGVEITTLDILNSETIMHLGAQVAASLKRKLAPMEEKEASGDGGTSFLDEYLLTKAA